MKRQILDELLAEVERIAGSRELVLIGSQAVHAATRDIPTEVVMSRECDLLLDEGDPLANLIDAELGPTSPYAAAALVHVDTVSSTFPFLAEGWEKRLVPFGPIVRALEIHDLVLSKLSAGRLKDYELVAVLFRRALADVQTTRDRITQVRDVHLRAILLARLQLVLESMDR